MQEELRGSLIGCCREENRGSVLLCSSGLLGDLAEELLRDANEEAIVVGDAHLVAALAPMTQHFECAIMQRRACIGASTEQHR